MLLIVVILVGIAVLLGAALVISMYDGGLGDVTLDHGDLGLPDRAMTADDIAGLRFRTGIRGYRMEDVDAALERLGAALREATGSSHGGSSPSATDSSQEWSAPSAAQVASGSADETGDQ